MTSISRRRRQLNIKENNLKYFLTPKPTKEEGEGENKLSPLLSATGSKGPSVRPTEKENLECLLETGNKKSPSVDIFNNKEVRITTLIHTLGTVQREPVNREINGIFG